MQYFTTPTSANRRRRVTVTHCLFYFFFLVFAFDVWWYQPMMMGFQTVVADLLFFSLFVVWVNILFDLLMSMVMGFQRNVRTQNGNGFAVFSFFFFFFFVWCLGLLQWFDRSDDHGYGFGLGKHFLWFIDECWDGFSTVVPVTEMGLQWLSFFSFVWCLGLLQWFDWSDDRGYGFSLGKHFIWFIDVWWDGFSTVVPVTEMGLQIFIFFLCLMFGFASMVWSEWWPWVWV